MPIGGVVINCRKEHTREVLAELAGNRGVEVHGADEAGNIVAVLDTETSEEMEALITALNRQEQILGVGLTYLNTEDEAEHLADGENISNPFGFRKPSINRADGD